MSDFDIKIAADLYNKRYEDHGYDIKTVGWGDVNSQQLRFDVLFRGLNPSGKLILDVGCGLGDMVPYLEKVTGGNFSYIGIDVADKLIDSAKDKHGGAGRDFFKGDIFSVILPRVDIAVLSGALSLKTEGIEEYAVKTMQRMFDICDVAVALNFLTKYVDFELEKNQHYYPELLFSKAKEISNFVNLIHDYPLYEFTLQLKKI